MIGSVRLRGSPRPVLVVQADGLNSSRLATVIVLALTTKRTLRKLPGYLFVSAAESGLPKDSLINGGQLATLDKSSLLEPAGRLDDSLMLAVDSALRTTLGL